MDNNASSGGSDDDRDNLIVSSVALVISLVALLATVAQVLHQYYASTANCGEGVMGQWSGTKDREFQWDPLRWEVTFETPVLFVCKPENRKGPIVGLVYAIDGSDNSLAKTKSFLPDKKHKTANLDADRADPSIPRKSVVHTADNERATWVKLLSELQGMERESREWQLKMYGQYPPPTPPNGRPPAEFKDCTLVVALQAKRRSWDTMPSNLKKPYATSTMGHMLEIAAMMGIYWREFDRSRDRYLAEGNGYILMGQQVPDLGLMFEFQQVGQRRFEENRVIPAQEVKELCCGIVGTLFRKDMDERLLRPYEDSPDLHWLHLGSQNEIAESLVLLTCNTNTANCLRNNDKKHGHLFPVAFELVGMLGKTLHIRNMCFRMLPNPTPYHWDKKFFTLRDMLKEFRNKVEDNQLRTQNQHPLGLIYKAQTIEGLARPRDGRSVEEYSLPLLNELHSALDKCDEDLRENVNPELLRLVLREHFQIVLELLNNEGQDQTNGASDGGGGQAGDATHRGHFDDLSVASPEEREAKFMDIYFGVVRPAVAESAVNAYHARRTPRRSDSNYWRSPLQRNSSHAGSVHSGPTAAASGPAAADAADEGFGNNVAPHEGTQTQGDALLRTQASNIWCTLVFRMLCYLLLHDFHKKDVQIPKSELVGSRLPVYIA